MFDFQRKGFRYVVPILFLLVGHAHAVGILNVEELVARALECPEKARSFAIKPRENDWMYRAFNDPTRPNPTDYSLWSRRSDDVLDAGVAISKTGREMEFFARTQDPVAFARLEGALEVGVKERSQMGLMYTFSQHGDVPRLFSLKWFRPQQGRWQHTREDEQIVLRLLKGELEARRKQKGARIRRSVAERIDAEYAKEFGAKKEKWTAATLDAARRDVLKLSPSAIRELSALLRVPFSFQEIRTLESILSVAEFEALVGRGATVNDKKVAVAAVVRALFERLVVQGLRREGSKTSLMDVRHLPLDVVDRYLMLAQHVKDRAIEVGLGKVHTARAATVSSEHLTFGDQAIPISVSTQQRLFDGAARQIQSVLDVMKQLEEARPEIKSIEEARRR